MKEIRPIDEHLLPGDTIHYYNFYGHRDGFGVFVKFMEHDIYPLTKRKILLKNVKTGKMWTITECKYKVYYSEHSVPDKKLEAFKIILNDLNTYK